MELLNTLFNVGCFDEISILLYRKPNHWPLLKEQFEKVIIGERLDLIIYFIKIRECRVVLDYPEIQKIIASKYMKEGNKIYYGAEMLNYIYKTNWDMKYSE